MSNIYFLVLASVLCYVQCLPLESSSKSVSKDSLHLFVNNSTKSTNYHLTSIMEELEDVDEEIARELDSILPYINFLFDTLLGRSSDEDDDGCVNDVIIQLVPDKDSITEHQDKATEPAVSTA
ncbi:uncharacterized protein LOC125067486 [Vanessa atalanta]|uniref:uncharacterized protein LOC125067486 n=1 Tax=Vanessa atalanta TaxID=42275 RepID=UPI001FCCDE08|nr:uncharacterized protein LOC125067486 [Vanessa atalanta]